MDNFDYRDCRGFNRTNAAYRIGKHRDRLDEMMAVALYPDGDGADDEMLFRYATDAVNGNPITSRASRRKDWSTTLPSAWRANTRSVF